MMRMDRFKNIKQIEPMIRSIRNEHSWDILKKSNGSKIDQIEAIFKEEKAIRSVEDKIRNFNQWLEKTDLQSYNKAAIKLLNKIKLKCIYIVSKRNK